MIRRRGRRRACRSTRSSSRAGVAAGETSADSVRRWRRRARASRGRSPGGAGGGRAIAQRVCWRWSRDFHKAQPLADGIPREEARERVFARAHPAVFELVLQRPGAAPTRLIVRDRLALPGHRLELSPEEARARDAVESAYKRAGLKPPDAATLAARERTVAPALVEKMTALLLRQKVLARVDTLIFHVEALQRLEGGDPGARKRRRRAGAPPWTWRRSRIATG